MDELVRLEVELARMILVDGWQSFKYMPGDSWGVVQNVDKKIAGNCPVSIWHTLPQRILAASPHFQGGDIPWDVVQELRDQGMGLVEALDLLGL